MGNCENQSILSHTEVPTLGRLGAVTDLKILNCIWEKDYQGLFDYQSKQIFKHIYAVKSNSLIMTGAAKGSKIMRETSKQVLSQQVLKQAAFQIVRESNYYKVLPIYIENEQYTIQKLLWLVVRTVPGHKYPLREKDIIKFGKQKIKIREIVPHDSDQVNNSTSDFNLINVNKKIYDDLKYNEVEDIVISNKEEPNHQVLSMATENQCTCRICLEPGELTNPLICACKCSGSVRYIHLRCLRMWLGKRLNVVKSKNCVTIKWSPLTCQMCKTHYKYRIYMDNKKFYTVQIPRPNKPYVVMEIMKKSAEYSKIFHFVSMAETSRVSIGRRKDIDIKISDDISVSRHHANLFYDFQDKKFFLQDNKSKFGTLVLIKRNLLINPYQKGLSLQMGGELFTFQTSRGEGSIPDYKDQTEYINILEKGQTEYDQESDENNEDDFQDEEDDDPNIGTHAHIHHDSQIQSSVGNSSSIIHPNTSSLMNPHSNNINNRGDNLMVVPVEQYPPMAEPPMAEPPISLQ